MKVGLLVALLLAAAFSGCFGQAKQDAPQTTNLAAKEITNDAQKRFEELTQVIPSNYTFPGQNVLEPAVLWVNDTIDATADQAAESPNDDGGLDLNTFVKVVDVSKFIPPRQAVEIHITLYWSGNPGQAADLDIYTNLPGRVGSYDPSTSQEWNWNVPVKRIVVDTVGVEGQKHEIGVQVTNGRIAPGQTVPYTLQLQFDYARDVLTPYHPYAFTLPEGATGVVLKSVKVTGDEHIQAAFALLSPQDELVTYQTYDDIAIPTESVFIPLRQPGEYVFYAYQMDGGFLSLKADGPVLQRDVRILPLVTTEGTDFNQPLAPGVVGHNLTVNSGFGLPIDGQSTTTPAQSGATAGSFNVDAGFPLRITGLFQGGQSVSGDAELIIKSGKGVVWDGVRSLRADLGDQGSVGWTGDHEPWVSFHPELLSKGAYSVEVTADGFTGQFGHQVLSYDRGNAAAKSGGS